MFWARTCTHLTNVFMYPCCLQDKYHLYFLFDLMSGGDLMDVLVAEAKVINRRVPQKSWQVRGGTGREWRVGAGGTGAYGR